MLSAKIGLPKVEVYRQLEVALSKGHGLMGLPSATTRVVNCRDLSHLPTWELDSQLVISGRLNHTD